VSIASTLTWRQSRRSIHLHSIDVGGGLHVAREIELQRPLVSGVDESGDDHAGPRAGGPIELVGPALVGRRQVEEPDRKLAKPFIGPADDRRARRLV
jgi:hypothetical protein